MLGVEFGLFFYRLIPLLFAGLESAKEEGEFGFCSSSRSDDAFVFFLLASVSKLPFLLLPPPTPCASHQPYRWQRRSCVQNASWTLCRRGRWESFRFRRRTTNV